MESEESISVEILKKQMQKEKTIPPFPDIAEFRIRPTPKEEFGKLIYKFAQLAKTADKELMDTKEIRRIFIYQHEVMQRDIEMLRDEVSMLRESIMELRDSMIPPVKTVVIREISEMDAENEIWDLIKNTDQKIFPSDIASKLNLDYDLTLKIIHKLIGENKIDVITEE